MDLKDKTIHHKEDVPHGTDTKVLDEQKVEMLNPQLDGILQENKPNPWGPGYLRMYLFVGLVCFASTMNGGLIQRYGKSMWIF